MDLIIDAVRWILWILCKGAFFIMDSIYSMIKTVVAFDIGTAEGLWDWWTAICSFLIFFIFIRIIAMFLHSFIDENYALKNNPLSIIFKIGCICVVLLYVPIIMPYFTSIGSNAIEQFDKIFVSGETFTTNIPQTGIANIDEEIRKQYEAFAGMPSKLFMDGISNGQYPLYHMININETEFGLDHWFDGVPVLGGVFNVTSAILGTDGAYVYMPDTTMLIFLIVEALCAAYLFFMIGIQMAQRLFSIGMKVLISPYPISGLINPDDQSFGIWAKLIAGDIFTNFSQFLLMKFVLMVTSSSTVINMGLSVQPFLFLGGMLCVLVGPGAIAQIIGGDGMGVNNTMQAMQSMRSMAHMGAKAVSYGSGAMAMAGAAGVYAGGRLLGGKSLSGGDETIGNAGAGQSGFPGGGNRGFGFTTDGNGFTGGNSNIPPKAFNEPATENQKKAAEKFGFNAEGMSKGDASLALEKAGLDQSYWHGKGPQGLGSVDGGANGTISDAGNSNYDMNNGGSNNFGSYEGSYGFDSNGSYEGSYGFDDSGSNYTSSSGAYQSSDYDDSTMNGQSSFNTSSADYRAAGQNTSGNSQSSYSEGSSQSSSINDEGSADKGTSEANSTRMTREGSYANRYADKAKSQAQSKGRPGMRNVMVAGAGSLYKASANRLFGQRTVMRRGQYIQRNTRPQSLANFSHTLRNATKPNPSESSFNDANFKANSTGEFKNPDTFDPYEADQGGDEL